MAVMAALGLIACSAGMAQAEPSVIYQAGDYQASRLGNDGYPSNYDTLTLTGHSGSFLLTASSPVIVPVAALEFGSGYSSYNVVTQYFNTGESLPWQLTVNGVTQIVSMPFSVNSNYTVDTMSMLDSTPLSFRVPDSHDTVSFMALGLTSYAFLDTTEGLLYGEFVLHAPEPSTLTVCLVTSLIGTGVACRRRWRKGC